jgi:hypothetical protein
VLTKVFFSPLSFSRRGLCGNRKQRAFLVSNQAALSGERLFFVGFIYVATLNLMFKIIIQIIAGITFLLLPSNELLAQSKNEYILILNKFEQWKSMQFKKGVYATENKCNPDTVIKKGYHGPTIGIPNDIDISFTDINNDNKLDAIITFNPDQCDGGNALMNAQIRVLILSSKAAYTTDDTYIDKIESGLKKGWLNIEKATYGTFFGTYYEYKEADGRCCPSIRRPFTIDYKTNKLEFTDK